MRQRVAARREDLEEQVPVEGKGAPESALLANDLRQISRGAGAVPAELGGEGGGHPVGRRAGEAAAQALSGYDVITANDLLRQRQAQVDQIRLFLRIVGLLALFIGGIGIINTVQVLLRRRQVEIAMLKTTGYRQRDLYALFGLETALLGIDGLPAIAGSRCERSASIRVIDPSSPHVYGCCGL